MGLTDVLNLHAGSARLCSPGAARARFDKIARSGPADVLGRRLIRRDHSLLEMQTSSAPNIRNS
jgi:hypothetical protein